jgi:hypothetical protein
MHLYVNGDEKAVMVTEGKQNPTGTINRSAALYIGHDSNTIIDELSISSVAMQQHETAIWSQAWFWPVVAGGILTILIASILFHFRKSRK